MNETERLAFILDIIAQMRDCADRGIVADEDRQWQYLDEIRSNAAYALRKCEVKK